MKIRKKLFLITITLSLILSALLPGIQHVFADLGTILSTFPMWYFPVSAFYPEFEKGTDLGIAVSHAGDFNGDGIDDIIFGAQKFSDQVYREGAVFAFAGTSASEGISNIPSWKIGGGQQGSLFGCEVAPLGDINDDGKDDIAVGACEYSNIIEEVTYPKVGAVYVFHGFLDSVKKSHDWDFIGDQEEARVGSALSGGDFNGDGHGDLLVGAPLYDDLALTNNGKVFLFSGSNVGLQDISVWSVSGYANSAIFGSAVANAGDVNGDGELDILIGAPQPGSSMNPQVGHAYVYHNQGEGVFNTTADWISTDHMEMGKFGASVAGVGDINGDTFDDVLIGSPGAKNSEDVVVGCAYLYAGSPDGLELTPLWQQCGDQQYGQFGYAVAAAGDINDDGYADILVSMPNYSISNEHQGAVFLYFGSQFGIRTDYIEKTTGNKADTEFGFSVSSAGDVNADGRLDVIVGAPSYKVNNERYGRAMLYYAGLSGIPDPDFARIFLPIILDGN
jgi:hypothetical protein